MDKKSVKYNYIMNMILTISLIIIPWLSFTYYSRILQAEGIGKVEFANTIINYFNMVAQIGIPTYGIRACAKVRDDKSKLSKVVHELLIINLIMLLFTCIIMAITVFSIDRFYVDRSLYFIYSFIMLFNAIGVEWLFKALEEYQYITIRTIIARTMSLIAILALVHKKEDIFIFSAIIVFIVHGSQIINFFKMRKYVSLKRQNEYDFKRHLKPLLVFFGITITTTIYSNLNITALGFIKGDISVGYFNVAIKIRAILVSIVTSLGVVLLPRVSYYVENEMMKDFVNISKKALNFVVVVGVPLVFYFIAFSEQSIRFVSGDSFLESVTPFAIIVPTTLLMGLSNTIGVQILVPLGKESSVFKSQISASIVCAVLCLILIPRFGLIGASFVALLTELTVLVVLCFCLPKKYRWMLKEMFNIKVLISSTIALLVALMIKGLCNSSFWVLVVTFFVYVAVYGLMLICLKEKMTLEILHIIKNLVKKVIKK